VERREGAEYYVFAGLKQSRMVKKCPYCGNEYPVNTPGRTCPSCGGNLDVKPD
jgi:rRNA maturation endonuclease Nob1